MKRSVLTLAILVFSSIQAMGQLKWENRELKFSPSISETNCVAKFSFSNPTDHPIQIKSIETSCGCTSATLDKKNYEPGEKGEIAANFIFGDRQGEQLKTLVVYTDDPKESMPVLRMLVNLPEAAKVTPSMIYWLVGETNAPKSIMIQSSQKLPIKIQSQSNQKFDVNLKTINEAKDYELVFTPKDTQQTTATCIMLEVPCPNGITKIVRAYALIKAAGSK